MHRLQRIRRTTRLKRRMGGSINKPLNFFQRFLNIFKSKKLILLSGWIVFMLCILMIVVVFSSCDSGCSISGWEI